MPMRTHASDAVATVVPRYRPEAMVNGEPHSGEFLISDVWVRRHGPWQVVLRSSSQTQPSAA